MTEARITLARHRLARARESFADGLLLFERGSRTGAVSAVIPMAAAVSWFVVRYILKVQ